ncbi:Ankyrin [Colletotrichum sp. SAR 10_98]|nr:Ankyrin [Colletotrichum sp. SAR 10_98]
MSDPLSIATGLIALIQVTTQATEYLKDVKDGGRERTKLRDELRSVTCLLEMLHDRVEDQGESENEDGLKPAAMAALAGPDGPLARMKATMEDIVSKLAPQAGFRKLAQPTISKLTSDKVHQVGRQLEDMDLEARVQEAEKILCWISSTSFRSKQADVLQSVQPGTERSRNMSLRFLLAALNLDFLSRKLTRRDVRSSLSILPKTLDATYEQALERIRTQAEEDVELAETIILWILCARRPLDVHELQHMYAIHLLTRDEGPNAEAILLEDDDLPPEDIITGVCGSLIVVDSTSKTVRLVHYTAQDYLNRTFGGHLHEPRMELTRISLEYLQLLNFEDGPALSDSVMVERLANFPFLDYAAKYWGAELQALQIEEIWEPVNRFLSNDVAVSVANQLD